MFVNRRLARVVGVRVIVVEREVGGVVGHGVLARLHVHLHARQREVLGHLLLRCETGDAVFLVLCRSCVEGVAEEHVRVERVVLRLDGLAGVAVV